MRTSKAQTWFETFMGGNAVTSTAGKRNAQRALDRFLDAARENGLPCEYAHLSCSNASDGACSDELAHIAEDAGYEL